jgi:DNA-binding Lrp family transcriptional regulator
MALKSVHRETQCLLHPHLWDCACQRVVQAWRSNHIAKKPSERASMSTCVFIQIRCKPGTTYKVAEDIALREIHSELYSTSGEYDLLMKLYIPKDEDVGKYINDHLLVIPNIERSLTTMTYKVF